MKLIRVLIPFLLLASASAQMPTWGGFLISRNWGSFAFSVSTGQNQVILCGVDSNPTTVSLSDTNGHVSFSLIDSTNPGGAGGIRIADFIGTVTSSGTTAITATGSAPSANGMECILVSNVSSTVDAHLSASTLFSGTPATISKSITTTKGQDFVWMYCEGFRNAGQFWNDATDTFDGDSNTNASGGAVHLISGAPGSTSISIHNSGNDQGACEVVALAASSFNIADTSLPTGALNKAYSYALNITGGASTYTCSITSGSLPAGMTFSSCALGGTPTSGGTFNLTFQASDGTSTPSKSLTLVINSTASTPAVVQFCTTLVGSCTFPGAVTVGNVFLSMGFRSRPANTTTWGVSNSCGDSLSNTLTWVGTTSLSGGSYAQFLFAGKIVSGGTEPSPLPGCGGGIFNAVTEFSGSQFFTDLYTQGITIPVAITTAVPNSMVVGLASNQQSSTTIAAVSPFTQIWSTSGTAQPGMAESELGASPGTFTPNFTSSASSFTQQDMAFRPSSTGIITNAGVPRKHGMVD